MNTELELIEGGDPISHQAAAWFARLRADDASEADRRQWRAWLAEDPRHCASYARLERLWSSLGAYAPTTEIAARMQTIPGAPKTARPGINTGRRAFALAAGWPASPHRWPAMVARQRHAVGAGALHDRDR